MLRFLNSFLYSWKTFSLKQKILFVILLILFLTGLVLSIINLINKITIIVPKKGGSLKIGAISHINSLNPILTISNDTDYDLINLIYNGLFETDGKGNLIPSLADKVEISSDKKQYTIYLKENVLWHDGVPFTSDDVVFTIESIQNPLIKSPLYLSWQGVIVEKINNSVVRFHLSNPYEPFLQQLTLKIIPKHIWEDINPYQIYYNEYNIKPIGTGPYLFNSLEKDKKGNIISYSLIANKNYFLKQPKITSLTFIFYKNYESAKEALLKKQIDALAPIPINDFEFFEKKQNFTIYPLYLSRYYAVFFNLNNNLFQNKDLRQALNLAIDRNYIVQNIFKNQAFPLTTPISPNFFGYAEIKQETNLNKAQDLINKIKNSKNGPKEIKFDLYLPDSNEMIQVANYLKDSWNKIGVEVNVKTLAISDLLKDIIANRKYDALLFGEIINQDPDLFPFWHSSQINDPGLNLSGYKNKDLDKLLEEVRQISDNNVRKEDLLKIQTILFNDSPAIFLYNPFYLYLLPSKIKGVNFLYANTSSERYNDINNWYLFTKRALKTF
ncbi:MAG: ABC transporter substrate-binding protein [Minisyncoccia bacterium]|jgi:peptide/nickel transport system substrate-binding protein